MCVGVIGDVGAMTLHLNFTVENNEENENKMKQKQKKDIYMRKYIMAAKYFSALLECHEKKYF